MSSTTQTAIVTPGKGEGLAALSVPRPDAASLPSDHVIVQVKMAGVNGIDVSQAQTGAYVDKFPYILGREWAGVVTAVGSAVQRLKVGDRVTGVGYTQPASALQEYLSSPASHVAHIPDSLSFEDASTLPHNYVASAMALFGSSSPLQLPLQPSASDTKKPILVWGASSSTGSYAAQTLRALGYSSVYGVAGPSSFAFLESIGVTPFDRNSGTEALKKFVEEKGIELVYVSKTDAESWGSILRSVKPGTKVSYITRAVPEDKIPKGITMRRSVAFEMDSDKTVGDALVGEHLEKMLKAGQFKPAKKVKVITDGSLLERAQEGYKLLEGEHVKENIVIRVGE